MYRVTIEQGQYAGEVGVGTTLAAAVEGLLARCPGLTDGVWWSWTDSNSPGVTCGARSFTFAVGRPVAPDPEPGHCFWCGGLLDPDDRAALKVHRWHCEDDLKAINEEAR
jgi:hypothetical protein